MIKDTIPNETQFANSQIHQHIRDNHRIINSFKAKADARRTSVEKIADWLTDTFGSIGFLLINVIWFVVWILINTGLVPGVEAFDPFPFGLLTMIVSLEAIILAIFVLISQNRASKIDDLREEIDLQINMISEREVTKILELQIMLLEKHGVDLSQDLTLHNMLQSTNTTKIERALERQMRKM